MWRFCSNYAHTNMPNCKFSWQVLLIHCFTAHLEVLVGNSVWLSRSCINNNVTKFILYSMRQARREQYGSWQRRNLHPHYSVSLLDETSNRPDDGLQNAINRAIAGAFQSSGETSIASNILNTSYRIQRWPFSRDSIPNVQNRKLLA